MNLILQQVYLGWLSHFVEGCEDHLSCNAGGLSRWDNIRRILVTEKAHAMKDEVDAIFL